MNHSLVRHIAAFLLLWCGLTARDSDYRKVVISILDQDTGAPVEGVKVTTEYWGEEKIRKSLSLVTSSAVTDKAGRAEVMVYKDALDESKWMSPTSVAVAYELEVKNDLYENHISKVPNINQATHYLIERAVNSSPSKPDFVFEMENKVVQTKAANTWKEIDERNERQAELWLKDNPDFWPTTDEKTFRDAEWKLVHKRWASGKKESPNPADSKEINATVLAHIKEPNPGVHEVRWITPSVVMVEGSWYQGPMAAASYYFVVQKSDGKWKVIREYLISIS